MHTNIYVCSLSILCSLLYCTFTLSLSLSPLDWIIDALDGPSCVAEMTGRRGRIVRKLNRKLQYETRGDELSGLESVNNNEVEYISAVGSVLSSRLGGFWVFTHS